jgi:HAD superfamily hydrolase (TIGR01509 family)
MALFERVFASHELRARKPEREAYLKVISALGLAPAECVFVDDDPANVEAAREVGMRAVLAEGTPSVEAGLRAMGVI